MCENSENQQHDRCYLSKVVEERISELEQKHNSSSLSEIIDKNTFIETSIMINSLLPDVSDSNLSLIDHLLYPDFNIDRVKITGKYTKKWLSKFNIMWFELYSFFSDYGDKCRSYIMRMTFYQMIEHSVVELFSEIFHCYIKDFIIECIINMRDLKKGNLNELNNICHVIKILRIISGRKGRVKNGMLRFYQSLGDDLVWLLNLKNLPKAIHPDTRKITSWLITETTILREIYSRDIRIPLYKNQYVIDKLPKLLRKNVEEQNTLKILEYFGRDISVKFKCKILYEWFMSAKDEEEKLELLKKFVLIFYKKYFSNCNFFTKLGEFIDSMLSELDHLFGESELLKQIEFYNGCDIIPYLSENSGIDVNQSEKMKSFFETVISDGIIETSERPDFTIEKYFFYDNLTITLQLLNIINTALIKCRELNWAEITDYEETEIFRRSHIIKKCLLDTLTGSSKQSKNPLFFHILMKKCPFMFLSKKHCNKFEVLVKVLNGNEVDEVDKERLYYAIVGSFIAIF